MEPEYTKKALDSDTEMKEAYSENSEMKKALETDAARRVCLGSSTCEPVQRLTPGQGITLEFLGWIGCAARVRGPQSTRARTPSRSSL